MKRRDGFGKLAFALVTLAALGSVADGAGGRGRARKDNDRLTLENDVLAVTWEAGDNGLRMVAIKDKLSGNSIDTFGEAFSVTLGDGRQVKASQLKMTGKTLITPPRFEGTLATVSFTDVDGKMRIMWEAVLGLNENFVRQTVVLSAGGEALPIDTVTLVDLSCSDAEVMGAVAGSPLIAEGMFVAYEHPNSTSTINGDDLKHVTCSLTRKMPLVPWEPLAQSSVIGVSPGGQLRRTFAQYIERERPRGYRPFLHYNSWYDIAWADRKMNEQQCLDVIKAFGEELTEKRGVALDSFVFDDGWDDNKTLWGFHPGFPKGFSPLVPVAEKYKSAIGVWLSPWGGYGQAKAERMKYGQTQGFEVNRNGFSLAGPKYYARFRDVCAEMITKYKVNYFKFDGVGIGNGRDGAGEEFMPDIEGLLRLCRELRGHRRDVYLSITTGTWPSPFWLLHGDSIWRNGRDCGFHGAGTKRQQWITYRDMITYRMIVKRAPLYPLNSLMNQGICYAQLGTATEMANDLKDVVDEIRMLFGCGTQLQELYVTPGMMTPPMWDALAQATSWSRRNADVLVDVHWIGGDPGEGEAYGYASWSPRMGILVLRNPGETEASFDVDIAEAFELPSEAAKRYKLADPWEEENRYAGVTLEGGQAHTFTLAPFEALVLEAQPLK